jgi:hypothetical protein
MFTPKPEWLNDVTDIKKAKDDYENWTTENLQNHSNYLYEEYLEGQDYLNDIYRISEILNDRRSLNP